MVKLRVKHDYINHDFRFSKGEIIDVDEATAHYLKTDSPGTFAEVRERKNRAVSKATEK